MIRRKKAWLQIAALACSGVLVAMLLASALHSDDSHNFNLKYRLWKLGWAGYESGFVRFLNVDVTLRQGLIGEELESVKELFPDLRSKDRANGYQSYYSDQIEHAEYYWIGDSGWTIEIKDSRVHKFHLWKG